MTKGTDDLEAVRNLVDTLEPFDSKDRERIIRWAREKLGMPSGPDSALKQSATSQFIQHSVDTPQPQTTERQDIKSFIQQKNPKNDRHLASVVAYYYHFEALSDQQKDFISAEDLTDACRKADRARLAKPSQTLVNAFNAGYLDKAGERGKYRLNSVGENLVAMVLPESAATSSATIPKKRKIRVKKKAYAKKKTARRKKAAKNRTKTNEKK